MAFFSDSQAIDIWKAKWRGDSVQSLISTYGENPFRFYEVWMELRNVGTRLLAFEELKVENPQLAAKTNPEPHLPKRRVVTMRHLGSDEAYSNPQLGFPF